MVLKSFFFHARTFINTEVKIEKDLCVRQYKRVHAIKDSSSLLSRQVDNTSGLLSDINNVEKRVPIILNNTVYTTVYNN